MNLVVSVWLIRWDEMLNLNGWLILLFEGVNWGGVRPQRIATSLFGVKFSI